MRSWSLSVLLAVALGGCLPTLSDDCGGDEDCPTGTCLQGVCVVGEADADLAPDDGRPDDGGRADAPAGDDARIGDAVATDADFDGTPIDATSNEAGLDGAPPDLGLRPDVSPDCVPAVELCNGLDDDCDGEIDEGRDGPDTLTIQCFEDPDPQANVGVGRCLPGQQTCIEAMFGLCVGQITSRAEVCNGEDDDCDGAVDEGLGESPCYSGPAETAGVGPCVAGVQRCEGGVLTVCVGERRPQPEICDGVDNDCNDELDDVNGQGCACEEGESRGCYTGSPGTVGVGACRAGTQVCTDQRWGACDGQVVDATDACDGADNDCDGRVDEQARTPCTRGLGACQATGFPVCVGEQIDCDAVPQAPREETCNGLDDNCDGVIDDGFPNLGMPCDRGLGACAVEGEGVCNPAGDGVVCGAEALPATVERCNGRDDDCDGAVDEGPATTSTCEGPNVGRCRPGARQCVDGAFQVACVGRVGPSAEGCDGADNDCDGRIDEGMNCGAICEDGETQACGDVDRDGIGECRAGQQVCVDGRYGDCVGEVGPAAEVCDGLDNDCDGAADDLPGAGVACHAGVGACRVDGTVRCDPDSGALACDAEPGPMSAERCDAVDNDCDGVVDEGLDFVEDECTVGVGACERQGHRHCQGGLLVCNAVAGPAGDERCDGNDDDCDGQTDEGFRVNEVCEVGVGACRQVGQLQCNIAGEAECSADEGAPQAEQCNGADDDCDGTPDEDFNVGDRCVAEVGECELEGRLACGENQELVCAPVVAPSAEVCDQTDNDCDGEIDEDLPLVGDPCGAECALGELRCTLGGEVVCDVFPVQGTPGPDPCGQGDEDCDDTLDEGGCQAGAICQDEVCVADCAQHFFDLDGDLVCERGCPAPPREPAAQGVDRVAADHDGLVSAFAYYLGRENAIIFRLGAAAIELEVGAAEAFGPVTDLRLGHFIHEGVQKWLVVARSRGRLHTWRVTPPPDEGGRSDVVHTLLPGENVGYPGLVSSPTEVFVAYLATGGRIGADIGGDPLGLVPQRRMYLVRGGAAGLSMSTVWDPTRIDPATGTNRWSPNAEHGVGLVLSGGLRFVAVITLDNTRRWHLLELQQESLNQLAVGPLVRAASGPVELRARQGAMALGFTQTQEAPFGAFLLPILGGNEPAFSPPLLLDATADAISLTATPLGWLAFTRSPTVNDRSLYQMRVLNEALAEVAGATIGDETKNLAATPDPSGAHNTVVGVNHEGVVFLIADECR